ncbi:MAG: glycerol kinase GlpK [Elusimicrobia bacterium]|nr:glycerol kinase GlpK [Elusimicrobiota bacterium]
MPSYILAIDQGTTGSAAAVMDAKGGVLSKTKREFRQIFPRPGWVEHDPEDIWRTVLEAVSEAVITAGVLASDIAAIGITNQRETTLLWDRAGGAPAHNAIVWQDRRTADVCAKLKKGGYEALVRRKTGLVLDPYFSGTKIRWLLDHVPGLRERARRDEVAFGTVDAFLLSRLTGGAVHATDVSNASRTLLMDLKTLQWDPKLCALLGVPTQILPRIRPSIGEFGRTKGVPCLPDGIPITGVAGDQQAALFGQACFEVGEAKCTFGTGSFALLNTGAKPVPSRSGCVTTVAWQWNGKTTYALEGSAFICGAAVQWLRDGLGVIASSSEVEALAKQVPDAGEVQFVPALSGLGAPYWRPDARGAIVGLTRGSTKAHLARAALEGMAMQNVDLLSAMERDLGRRIRSLKVDGGAAANDLLMQLQADYLGVRCVRPSVIETTSAGAAFMAGLGAGLWSSADEVRRVWKEDRVFEPKMSAASRKAKLRRWQDAVSRT